MPAVPIHTPAAARIHAFSPGWLTAVVAVLLLALLPATAHAHGHLTHSAPAADATLHVVPAELRLTFSEAPELGFTEIRLVGPDSAEVALGGMAIPADSPRTVVVPVRGALAAGSYTVIWKMAGMDGHPMHGGFSFVIAPGASGIATSSVAAPSGDANAAAAAHLPNPAVTSQQTHLARHASAASEDDDAGAEAPWYVVVRWMELTALLVVIGAAAFHLLVLRPLDASEPAIAADARRAAATLGMRGAVLLAVSALLRLFAESAAMHGGSHALDGGLLGEMVMRTAWGWAWLLQVAASIAAAAAFASARRDGGRGWMLAAVAAAVLAFTPALSGHAVAAEHLRALTVLADGLHVLGAGGWLGSLLMLVAAGLPAALRAGEDERGTAAARLVHAFSPAALACTVLVIATGLFAAWVHVGSLRGLAGTHYGRLLIVKMAILLVTVTVGAYNWRIVRPGLRDEDGARHLRGSAKFELATGLLILLVTAILVATPTAVDLAAR
ncbi:MAG TPA: CopD family protein [Longimicrobiaceae bacterium]|jgi:putative copper export protein/methionine-rich copper-binding protein CopC|nr:CopD family protein [Longimicrobiaceae bacterium]